MRNELAFLESESIPAKDKMLRLGTLHNEGMAARIKAMQSGCMPIHDALCKFTNAIETEQKALLASNPELLTMFC